MKIRNDRWASRMNPKSAKTRWMGGDTLRWALAALALGISGQALAGAVPVYPGAAFDAVGSATGSHASGHALKVYLSGDSLQRVRAWYRARLAKQSVAGCTFRNPREGCGAFKQRCESVAEVGRWARCRDEMVLKWNYIPPGGSMVDAFNAGVHLAGWRRLPGKPADGSVPAQKPQPLAGRAAETMARLDALSAHLQGATGQAMQQLDAEGKQVGLTDTAGFAGIPDLPFKGLKEEVLAGRHSQQELEALYEGYRWLPMAFYPMKRTANGVEDYAHWLVARTEARIHARQRAAVAAAGRRGEDSAQTEARIEQRMQQLIQHGRMGEARKLAERMASAIQGSRPGDAVAMQLRSRDHWQEWVTVLKRLAAHAYKTKIVIDTF